MAIQFQEMNAYQLSLFSCKICAGGSEGRRGGMVGRVEIREIEIPVLIIPDYIR